MQSNTGVREHSCYVGLIHNECPICFPCNRGCCVTYFDANLYKPTNQGWECPKCGRVYSPYYPSCDNCGKKDAN